MQKKWHARNATRNDNPSRHKPNAAKCRYGSQPCIMRRMTQLAHLWATEANVQTHKQHMQKRIECTATSSTTCAETHKLRMEALWREMAGDMPSPSTSQADAKTHMPRMHSKTKGKNITSNSKKQTCSPTSVNNHMVKNTTPNKAMTKVPISKSTQVKYNARMLTARM